MERGELPNDALARDMQRLTRLQVSFLSRQANGAWKLQASTLQDEERQALLRDVAADHFAGSGSEVNSVSADESLTRVVAMPAREAESVIAVLQEPLSAALEPFRRLQRQLLLISLLAVFVSIVASVLISRSIARPVRELARVARRIAAGPPVAIRLAKRSLYANEDLDLREALQIETMAQNICFETEDATEGIRAFGEKRAPVFKGR